MRETWNDEPGRPACGPSPLSYIASKVGSVLMDVLPLYLFSMGRITGHL